MTISDKARIGTISLVACIFWVYVLFLLAGCRDNVANLGPMKTRTLTVHAMQKDQNGLCTLPVEGASIAVMQMDADGERQVATLTTDANGSAVHTGDWPVAGVQIKVVGTFSGMIAFSQPEFIKYCRDTSVTVCFDSRPPNDICCDAVNDSLNLTFLDERGSSELRKNMPKDLKRYTMPLSIARNSCRETNLCLFIDSLPSAPFTIFQAFVVSGTQPRMVTLPMSRDNPVVLHPGEILNVVFAAGTENVGMFHGDFLFRATCCDSAQPPSTIRVRCDARVVEMQCACPSQKSYNFTAGATPIAAGRDALFDFVIDDFPAECDPIILDSVKAVTTPVVAWRILNTLPEAHHNGRVVLRTTFSPTAACDCKDTCTLYLHLANGVPCTLTVYFSGRGCLDSCPTLELDKEKLGFSTSPWRIAGKNVAFSSPECRSTEVSTNTILLGLNEGSCCAQMRVGIDVRDDEATKVASRYFVVTPRSSIAVPRGGSGALTVRFTAPTLLEFNTLFTDGSRVRTGTAADSTFTIRILLSSTDCGITCSQEIIYSVEVSQASALSPIGNLRAFRQVTDLVSIPAFEVCHVDSAGIGRTRGMGDGQGRAVYPPYYGDIWVDVEDPSIAFPPLPKKDPVLLRSTGSAFTHIRRIATNYPENNFVTIQPIRLYLQSLLAGNPGYLNAPSLPFTLPITAASIRPVPGEVYLLSVDSRYQSTNPELNGATLSCQMALLYVRSRTVGQGEENANTNHQSGIEFRIIYPVLIY